MRITLCTYLFCLLAFPNALKASDLGETKDDAPMEIADSKDEAYQAALRQLEKMDICGCRLGKDAPLIGGRERQHLVLQFLDLDGLIKLRNMTKTLYYSEAIKWLGFRLNDQFYHQVAHPKPRQINTPELPAHSASEIRAILCLRRRLRQLDMKPTNAELAFIEQKLAHNKNYQVAMAFLPALRGDEAQTYDILKSLADAGDSDAQMSITQARRHGVLGQVARKNITALSSSQTLADLGHSRAKKLAVEMIYYRSLGVNDQAQADRLLALKNIAATGGLGAGILARMWIVKTIYERHYGYGDWTESECFQALKDIAAAGDSEANRLAQRFVAGALNFGQLDQGARALSERLAELEDMARFGSCRAQMLMVNRVRWSNNITAEKFSQLQRMAQDGYSQAENCLIDLIYGSWDETMPPTEFLSKTKRLAILKAKAGAGNHRAQKYVCTATFYGMFDEEYRPAQEGFAYLEEQSGLGNIYAERLLANCLFESALGRRNLGQGNGYGLERLKAIANGESAAKLYAQELVHAAVDYLKNHEKTPCDVSSCVNAIKDAQAFVKEKEKATAGSREAWETIITAIYEGNLGQRHKAHSDRFAELCALSNDRDPTARYFAKIKIGQALSEGTLGQDNRSMEERLSHLQAMAATGVTDIQYNQIKKLRNEPARVLWLYYDFYNALLKALMPESLEEE